MTSLTFVGGLILGAASSIHCAGMCGGIGSSIILVLAPSDRLGRRLIILGEAQLGKMAAYVAAGAILGALGAALYGVFDHRGAFSLLQKASALVLSWTALGMVGILPPPSIVGHLIAKPGRRRWPNPNVSDRAAPFVAGIAWGIMPCGMAYAALMYAMLAGSALNGALVMAGFGIGTTALVTASAIGISQLSAVTSRPITRWTASAVLIATAVLSLLWPASEMAGLCG